MRKKTKILIVGAGPMAIEYAKVLQAQKSEFITVGNTKVGANNFENDIKTKVVLGGVENWLKNNSSIDFSLYKVIVTVNEHLLGTIAKLLINAGFKHVYWLQEYRETSHLEIFDKCKVKSGNIHDMILKEF